jgi:hypothetical protein
MVKQIHTGGNECHSNKQQPERLRSTPLLLLIPRYVPRLLGHSPLLLHDLGVYTMPTGMLKKTKNNARRMMRRALATCVISAYREKQIKPSVTSTSV